MKYRIAHVPAAVHGIHLASKVSAVPLAVFPLNSLNVFARLFPSRAAERAIADALGEGVEGLVTELEHEDLLVCAAVATHASIGSAPKLSPGVRGFDTLEWVANRHKHDSFVVPQPFEELHVLTLL